MKNIERIIYDIEKDLNVEMPLSYIKNDSNNLLNILFKLLNDFLDENRYQLNQECINKVQYYIELIIKNDSQIDRKLLQQELEELEEKIISIKLQGNDIHNFMLEKLKKQVEEFYSMPEDDNNKEYELVRYLVDDVKDFSYLEYIFRRIPQLIYIQDKEGIPLYRNIIKKYIDSIELDDKTDFLYYTNVVFMLVTLRQFVKEATDKKEIVEEINKKVKILNKDSREDNERLGYLINLRDLINQQKKKIKTPEQLAIQYNINVTFPERLAEAVDLSSSAFDIYSDRVVIKDNIITIDKKNTIEIDDALSCKKLSNGNYLLGIHVASVLGYIPYESSFIDEAIKRNRTIYLPKVKQGNEEKEQTIFMFPYNFLCQRASLKDSKIE